MNCDPISRESIIARLLTSLEPLEQVLMVWEGGSAAFERLDEYSDIDLYVLVTKGAASMVLDQVEESLESLTPIQIKYMPTGLPWPGVSQAFYKLEGVPAFLLLDLALIEEGSPEQFLEEEIHGRARIYLSRENVPLPRVERLEFTRLLEARVENIRNRFMLFSSFLEKEIRRGNLIDALEAYRRVFLDTLVALLRIRYCPTHHDFGATHIHHELPASAVQKLERLYLTKGMEDLRMKSEEVRSWIFDLLSELGSEDIGSLVDRTLNP